MCPACLIGAWWPLWDSSLLSVGWVLFLPAYRLEREDLRAGVIPVYETGSPAVRLRPSGFIASVLAPGSQESTTPVLQGVGGAKEQKQASRGLTEADRVGPGWRGWMEKLESRAERGVGHTVME